MFNLHFPPNFKYGKYAFDILTHRYFYDFIFLAVIGNMIVISLYYDDCPVSYSNRLNYASVAFEIIFILEIFMKIMLFKLSYF